jgi:hypothetical protein
MPARTGKCINFGGCNKADSKEVMTIPEGDEFVCPDCEKSLMPAGGGAKGGSGGGGKLPLKVILASVLGIGVIGAIVAFVIGHNSPTIQNLSIEPAQIDAGQTATLKWSVDHATDVSIDPGLGPVQTEDTFPVSPRGTTTYTLTAKKGSNVVTKSVTLQVNIAQLPPAPIPAPAPGPVPAPAPVPAPGPGPAPRPVPAAGPPVITSFSATPGVVQAGQTLVLQWSTRNARSVSIPGTNPPRTNLPAVGSFSITPRAPGVFPVSLMATGQGPSARKTIMIRVMSAQRGYVPQPVPGPGPQPQPVYPPPVPNPEPAPEPPSTPASGTLIWEGEVQGTQLVTIQGATASPGQLMSAGLPGREVILQPENEKKVGIASAPSPDNQYRHVVLRVFGHGHTRVVVHWSTP